MNRLDFLKYLLILGISPKILLAKDKSLEEKLYSLYSEIDERFNLSTKQALIVDGGLQKLYLVNQNGKFGIKKSYEISTAKKGFSNTPYSWATPTGIHKIRYKYGHKKPLGTLFSGENAGTIVEIDPFGRGKVDMTGRVMRLEGCEEKNKATFSRGIYIHGASSEGLIGQPASNGCIRMRNDEVIELYDLVDRGTYVYIKEKI